MTDLSTLGERVKWALDAAGISARRLDEIAGLAHGHVSAIVLGNRPGASGATVTKLADALDVSADWLLGREGAREPVAKRVRAAIESKRVA